MDKEDFEHKKLIELANVKVLKESELSVQDPLRPFYHLMSASSWIGDPNGPIFFNNEYHMFFQHNPYEVSGNQCSWGHAKSSDLVHWELLPIALTNGPQDYDFMHVASGCCVINEGIPTIIYTGMSPINNSSKNRKEVQCIAHSYDGMKTWSKSKYNPVVIQPPREDLVGFRDPFAWREGDTWYIIIGSGIKGVGGTALLYQSKDLIQWEYLNPLCVGFGEMWECPNFFPLGDKHVLIVSPYGPVMYAIGTYKNFHFIPDSWHQLDAGSQKSFYAPNSLEDEKGRRIIWGWIMGGGSEGYPWDGAITLPRKLFLRSDGQLGIKPVPELENLRGEHVHLDSFTVKANTSIKIRDIKGKSLEIIVEFEPKASNFFGTKVRCSPDEEENIILGYNTVDKKIISGNESNSFELISNEDTLKMHIYLDNSIIEMYVNERICFTSRIYPKRYESQGISLFSVDGSVRVKSFDCWLMHRIW